MKYSGVLFLMLSTLVFGATHQVNMVGVAYEPDTLNITEGDSVLWVNTSALTHTTTSGVSGVPDGYWDSGLMPPNDSFTFHFDSSGVFPYYCTPHWILGMIGLITVAPVGIDEIEIVVPNGISSLAAYPNPFTQTVRIDYSVNSAGPLKIAVYNSAGQFVMSLMDLETVAGNYTSTWDGIDAVGIPAAPGVYFIRAYFKGAYLQDKVILLK